MNPRLKTVIEELERRKAVPKFQLKEFLFDKQLAFAEDPARFKTAVTTRRAGKTVACAADLVETALSEPEIVCLYITLARTVAKRNIWPEIKRIGRKYNLEFQYNESDLSATAPNGSIIYLSGASDRSEIEKFRGLAIKKVYLDETQSFPAYIENLIDEVLAPALMDYAGSLILIGTPGPVPTGYFYDCSVGTKSKKWSHHVWSFFDNPYIALKSKRTHKELLDEELSRTGLEVESPKIQREWFGRWLLDTDTLVYKYGPINHYDELPKGEWNYLLGVDLGFNDADALAVLAWSTTSPATYLVDEIVTRQQGLTELVEQIERLQRLYPITKIVIDTGGLGKKIAEEVSRRYKIAVQPAEKVRKHEYIELMNDALRTGQLMARKDSRFAQDCMKVEWDLDKTTPDRKVISSRFHSDICEAVLYAWRESWSFTHSPAKLKPKYGSPEAAQEEVERMEEEAIAYFEALEKAERGDY